MSARGQEKHTENTEMMYETRGTSGSTSLIGSTNIWETAVLYHAGLYIVS